jgi:ubiquinone biosynthesis protein
MMRVETDTRLFGYPAIAMVLFLVGAGLGLAIVASALLGDRKPPPREEHGPR